MSDRVAFTCNGAPVDVPIAPGESLLTVLRERLDLTSVKDGCAPQGQCGCCTVLVDGDPRVACVTPASRVTGRSVTTVEGLEPETRDAFAASFVETGGSQCGFCTPGIVVRAAGLAGRGRTARVDLDRALAAHLCRCTGWQTVYDAIQRATSGPGRAVMCRRDLDAASLRARLEGGSAQRVGVDVPLGGGGFAEDTAPADALVAVPRPPGSAATAVDAVGISWVLADSLGEARALAGSVQGRRSPGDERPPLPLPSRPLGGVRLATGWVEPAYLEPDASWCEPGGEPATPLANGGAFGGKVASIAPRAARELAERLGRAVRVVLSREDCVRLGPKRPPVAATAVVHAGMCTISGAAVLGELGDEPWTVPYRLEAVVSWRAARVPGPPTSTRMRAFPHAEQAVLLEGAIDEAGLDRSSLVVDPRVADVLLDTCASIPGGSLAGARVELDPATGAVVAVRVRVAAGDPLDEIVLRSYCTGAAHMALGWVLSEGLSVDPETGEVHDLTIRSFGVIRAKDTPPIDVTIADDAGAPCPRASDAAFAAVAAATWNALAAAEGSRPEFFPARSTRASALLRR